MTADYFVRPMAPADVPEVERLTDAAFFDLDTRTRRHRLARAGAPVRGRPPSTGPPRSTTTCGTTRAAAGWPRTTAGCSASRSPSGARPPGCCRRTPCGPACRAAGSAGSCSTRRWRTAPAACTGSSPSSEDPLAVRRYRLAGFTLHPAMLLWGTVPRAALPVVERVREGSLGDVDADGLRGPADPRRRARRRPRGLAATYRLIVATGRPARATPTSGPAAAPTCWRRPTGAPPPTCSGRRWPRPPPTCRSASTTSPPRTSGRSTSGWPAGWSCGPAATSRCGGSSRRRRTCTAATSSEPTPGAL